mmetsp:Transcript_41691/g.130604  ORF Transcript_41691/g.130604 Transcript_41691/m.130604 type:complete len:360 (-) Transcript_41691:101-1180(-)
MARAAREGHLSVNELVDDVETAALPLLLLPYMRAQALERSGPAAPGVAPEEIMGRRAGAVRSAKAAFSAFLNRALDLELLAGPDLDAWRELEGTDEGEGERRSADPNAKRLRKIERYRRQQAAVTRIAEIDAALRSQLEGLGGGAGGNAAAEILRIQAESPGGEALENADELIRERWEIALSHAIRDAVEQLGSLTEEMGILEFMAARRPPAPPGGGPDGSNRGAPQSAAEDGRMRQRSAVPDPNRPGLTVTHLDRGVDGLVTERRETVKANVFRPYHNLPTMSLEEFAQQEMEDAMRREAASKAAEENPGPRRMDQLERDGDEDDAELAEQAAYKDRAWDDWKDDHPRGMGNKMGKRF